SWSIRFAGCAGIWMSIAGKKKPRTASTRAGVIAFVFDRTLSTSVVHHRAMALRPGPSTEETGAHTTRAESGVTGHGPDNVRVLPTTSAESKQGRRGRQVVPQNEITAKGAKDAKQTSRSWRTWR